MSGSIAPLAPTFNGHIATTMDAAILFEACLQGRIPHVPRRPHDRERQDLIASGNVFIYEEHASGIKRWTDGVSWSPSRILGNFLIYRELEKPFPRRKETGSQEEEAEQWRHQQARPRQQPEPQPPERGLCGSQQRHGLWSSDRPGAIAGRLAD